MTDTKRDAPIPADKADHAKPWRLPFWTEPPAYVVEREKSEAAEAEAEENLKAEAEAGERHHYPTAEEVELIRREAYNAGLEQGLVEGRQQGVNQGLEEGRAEGLEKGHAEGFVTGQKDGLLAGEKAGREAGRVAVEAEAARVAKLVATLQAEVALRDRELPDVLAGLIAMMTQHVLQHELSLGAQSILTYVNTALAALPSGEKNGRVVVSTKDAALLKTALDNIGRTLAFDVDSSLAAGECRVESEHSLIEYSVSDHMQQQLIDITTRMLTHASDFPSYDETSDSLVTEPDDDILAADISEDIHSADVDSADADSADADSADADSADVDSADLDSSAMDPSQTEDTSSNELEPHNPLSPSSEFNDEPK
ncbi:FliH/SctL family protein [Thalassolituus oleivorans]|uniref:FliH/SctL family protein n=1 Tax=Thalassolituus oleivorans TaxID=187493 RepID=UPI0024097066|nr:FliH/SctL family protein [Thalassolituus oleivorans]MDF1641584.1 FliH/SctL family protein [Thalassolituus oleivorans]